MAGLVAFAIVSGVTSYLSAYSESISAMRQQNRALVSHIDGWISLKGSMVEHNAMLLRSPSFEREAVMAHFAAAAQAGESAAEVYVGFPDGTGFSGGAALEPPTGWVSSERPWYAAAAQRPGEIAFALPYAGAARQLVFASARTVGDLDDSLGVVAIGMPISALSAHIAETDAMSGSYSFIMDAAGNVLLHPNPAMAPAALPTEAALAPGALGDFILQNKNEIDGGRFAQMVRAVTGGGFYVGGRMIYIGAPLETTGWYVVTRISAIYILSNVLAPLASITATVLFAVASLVGVGVMLRKLKRSMQNERETNELNEIFFSSSPFVMNIWDDNYSLVATSKQSVTMFGLADQRQYIEDFFTLSPEFQPCGTPSSEKALAFVKQAFIDGRAQFEWMHQTASGEPLPAEITLVRFTRQGKYMLAAYTSDLRPIKMAMQGEREAIRKQRLMYNSLPIPGSLWDKSLEMLDCNEAMVSFLGLSDKSEVMGRFFDFSTDSQPCGTPTREKFKAMFAQAFEEGRLRQRWTHLIDNKIVPVDINIVRLPEKDHFVAACYAQDLRPLMEAAEKVQEAEERVQLMLNAIPIAICLYDTNLTPLDCNREAVRMFGLSNKESFLAKEAIFMPPLQPDGTDSKKLLDGLIMKTFEEGGASSEYVCEKADGSLIPVETTFVRVKYQGDNAVLEYSRDMTQIKAAIAKEREAEERVKLVLDASPLACYLLDENRQAIDCNQATIELFGKKPGELLAKTYPEEEAFGVCKTDCEICRRRGNAACVARKYLVNNYRYTFPNYEQNREQIEKSVSECCAKALREGMLRFEFPSMTLYGETIPSEVTIVPVKFSGGQGFAVYLRDLRESKKMVAEMQRREIAEEESRSKTRFLARMSHEIRTPMNAVLGIAEIQLQKETHPTETEEAFLRIYSSSKLLLTIINDILDLSKVEAGKMEIIPAAYETTSLIEDTVQLNLMYFDSRKIGFELKVDESLPACFVGDELRIKQILNNLLSNAYKYTQEGLITLSFALEPAAEPDEAILVIGVTDTGQGMTAEQIDRLFSAEFTRFNIQSNRAIEGTGLGMSIAHSLIKMMQGEVMVESAIGEGTTFTVRLPQKTNGSGALGREAAEHLQKLEMTQKSRNRTGKFTLEPMPYGRVLVVDDVDINLYVAEGILMSYEIAVETAESGQAAIDKVKSGEAYDIIFMDHMMPGMDGIEATKIIRDMGYAHPIVALTANAVKDSAEMFMNNGFSGFISKPIDVDKLNVYLERFIHDKHAAAQNPPAKPPG